MMAHLMSLNQREEGHRRIFCDEASYGAQGVRPAVVSDPSMTCAHDVRARMTCAHSGRGNSLNFSWLWMTEQGQALMERNRGIIV